MLDQLAEVSRRNYVTFVDSARIYAGLGEEGKAFEWLGKTHEEGCAGALKMDPAYDPLRSDPRFADLLRRMNIQP